MSVAFRRESDDEHLEPRFELPIPTGPNLVTARGLELLQAKAGALREAVAAEPDAEARKALQRELRYWDTRVATAELAPAPQPGVAGIGSRVRFAQAGKERTVELVGHDEAEPAAGRIAFSSPLARALIGAEAGDVVDFAGAPDGIEVLAVTP